MAEPAAAVGSQLRSAYTTMRMRLRAARTEAERQEIRGWLKRLERALDAEHLPITASHLEDPALD